MGRLDAQRGERNSRAKQLHWVQEMKRLIIVGVMAVVAAACSADGSTAATTVPPPISTVVVDTAASTTTPATSSTTSSGTTTTTTMPETTTTTVPTESLIKQAVQDYAIAYHACGAAPASCLPQGFTATQGPSRSIVTQLATGMAAQGFYFSTDLRGSYLAAESVSVNGTSEATTVFCAYDAGAVLGPNGPDGQATVINDVIASVRYEFHLFLEDGTWRVGEQRQLERLGEGMLCPPAQ